MSTILYFDMGNTRIKFWGCVQNALAFDEVALHHRDLAKHIPLILQALDFQPQVICGACVLGEEAEQQFAEACQVRWGLSPVFARSSTQHSGVISAYQASPESLGVDRWLGLIAARAYQRTLCLVSCGSAITIDVLDAEGQHQGGYILPGFTMMRDALLSGTGKVRFEALSWATPALGHATAEAVGNGALAAILALIDRVQHEAKAPLLLLTGGDAPLLLPHLQGEVHHIPDLLLKGMQRYFTDAGINKASEN